MTSTLRRSKTKDEDHWTVKYANERAFFKVLKQFIDLRKFGRAFEDKPYHVNPWKNPFPFWFPSASKRSADKLAHEDCLGHLRGDDPLFTVNTPKQRVHEIVFDIDDVDPDRPCDGFAVAKTLEGVLIPEGAEVFTEPSRHRRGAYLRMLIKRESSPKQFNKLLMQVCRSIQSRHNELFISQFNAKVCGIKGTVWYRFDNPRFDPGRFEQEGAAYEKRKGTYSGMFFEPQLALERYRYSRGVLVTAACFGCYKDAPERYRQYLEWATWKAGKKVISEAHLREWLLANPAPSKRQEPQREGRGEGEINSICQMNESLCDDSPHDGNDLDLSPLRSTPDAWKRTTECYKRLCRILGRPASFKELWSAYHEQKLNTGEDVNDRRRVRLQKVQAIYSVTFDEALSVGGGYARRADALTRLIRDRVGPEHFADVKYKGPVNETDLTVGAYVVEVNAFRLHPDPDQQYTCGNDAFAGMFDALSERGVIPKRACGREKAAAVKLVLQNAGLIECLDPRWMPKHLSTRNKGTSKKFGLGIRHPRYDDFQFVLKHQPIVKVGVKAIAAGDSLDVLWPTAAA